MMDPPGNSHVPIDSEGVAASLSLADVDLENSVTAASQSPIMVAQQDDQVDPTEVSEEEESGDERPSSPAATSRSSRRTTGMALLCVSLLVVVLILVPAISISNKNKDKSSSPTNNNNNVNVVPRGERADLDDVISYFSREGVSTRQALETVESPQHQAAVWLSQEDPAFLPLPAVGIADPMDSTGYLYLFRYVMALMYFSMNGINWITLLDFMSSKYVCLWNGFSLAISPGQQGFERGGVQCSQETGLPVMLDLEYNNLEGEIPTELGLLTSLEYLDLEYNFNIGGTIPTELCNLSKLRYLSLAGNILQGEIPACMDQWKLMEILSLGNNNLSGELPQTPEFCELVNMQLLVMDKNFIQGSIPDCITNWKDLLVLSVSDNAMTGPLPSQLGQLAALEELYVDGNIFNGDPTAVVSQLTTLELLYMESNRFTGTIDDNFVKDLQLVRALDISNNQFTSDGFPPHLLQLSSLIYLDCSQNQLRGHLPEVIPLNEKLLFLSVHKNKLDGPMSGSSLTNLTGLQHLDFSQNKFHGPLRKHFFQMPSLRNLFLSENPALHRGHLPLAELANMTQLLELSLKNTNRTGPLPAFLGFEDIFLIDLDNNQFTGTVPANYGYLPTLRHLLLNRNNLTGVLPEFNQAHNLGTILLDGTGLTGSLASICALPIFQGTKEIASQVLAVADCGDGDASPVTCDCCHCCSKSEPYCSDPLVASLDWTWEAGFRRTVRDFAINNSLLEPPQIPPGVSGGGGGRV